MIRRSYCLACCAGILALSVLVAAAEEPAPEYRVKAVYLVKFIEFVDWPDKCFASGDSPLVMSVLGTDRFGGVLDEAAYGDVVKHHRLVIRRYHSVKDAAAAQAIFIDRSESSRLRSIMRALKDRNVLTISDIEAFCDNGGMVHFLTEHNKVRFRVNVDAAKRAELEISSKLLQSAEIVRDKER